jgi:hypothetical protein
MFTCASCKAVCEQISDGAAQLSIVRHQPGCEVLAAQTRARWPDKPAKFPTTPRPTPFERLGDYGTREGERRRLTGTAAATRR